MCDKLCVKELCVCHKVVCAIKLCVKARRRRRRRVTEYRTKNKNPTQRCEEKLTFLSFEEQFGLWRYGLYLPVASTTIYHNYNPIYTLQSHMKPDIVLKGLEQLPCRRERFVAILVPDKAVFSVCEICMASVLLWPPQLYDRTETSTCFVFGICWRGWTCQLYYVDKSSCWPSRRKGEHTFGVERIGALFSM